jgi:type I restriction enzyme S subunit
MSFQKVFTRRFSEAFKNERLDSEHYREKYYVANKRLIAAGAKTFIPLGDLLTTLTNGHTPLHHDLRTGTVPFLCAEHVSNFEACYDSDKRILLEHHNGELARTALRKNDVLLTIKGRVGNLALVENVVGPININQDVALLRLNSRLPIWFILAFVNSFFGQLQTEQLSTGGINPFLGLSNVRRLNIPEFPPEVMMLIADQTKTDVHAARRGQGLAKDLLEKAKTAIEIAIDQNEATALKYLLGNTEA